jgi:transcriptional regulator with XRE-family HTH domain
MDSYMNDNSRMSEITKRNMSERLNKLMSENPSMDTIKKVASRSGVSFGTVRRIRNAEPNDPSIAHVEAVAKAFGLSLIEFVSAPNEGQITEQERQLIADLRCLSPEDAQQVVYGVKSIANLRRLTNRAKLIEIQPDDQSKAV